MANFTPVSAAVGGALIGLSAVLLMLFTGRIAGVSGIFDGRRKTGYPRVMSFLPMGTYARVGGRAD
jgi:uncharacterized membrane protein YedE/YeeE